MASQHMIRGQFERFVRWVTHDAKESMPDDTVASVEVRGRYFRTISAGGRDGAHITLYGDLERGFLCHELTHLRFPSPTFLLHEGFAEYVQTELAGDGRFLGFSTREDFLHAYLRQRETEFKTIDAGFLLDERNYNDPRLCRMTASRAAAFVVVRRLVEDVGVPGYLSSYHSRRLSGDEVGDLWRSIARSIGSGSAEAEYDSYFGRKRRLAGSWEPLVRNGIERIGHPLANYADLDTETCARAQHLFIRELETDLDPHDSGHTADDDRYE